MMTGEQIKTVLEDVCDNLQPRPYYQQGGDMVRVGGLQYACDPNARMGARITDMRRPGKPLEAGKTWQGGRLGAGVRSPGQEGRRRGGVGSGGPLPQGPEGGPPALNLPTLKGMAGNPGMA